jgi:hypothetical protein
MDYQKFFEYDPSKPIESKPLTLEQVEAQIIKMWNTPPDYHYWLPIPGGMVLLPEGMEEFCKAWGIA